MKEIGGYFELELNKNREYHNNALKLNSGRNALLFILMNLKPRKIYLPYYICDSVLESVRKMNISIDFYEIQKDFEPKVPSNYKKNDSFLYVNYFGINDSIVEKLSKKLKNLITDNSQAFFCKPYKTPTFYSPRKFFGVPDGAYLYLDVYNVENLEREVSHHKCSHLLKRIDLNASDGYNDFKKSEQSFSNQPVKRMSKLTERLLCSIDYTFVKSKREENFIYLHENLNDLNELNLDLNKLNGPMIYPFLIQKDRLKTYLNKNKIYIATYWEDVLNKVKKEMYEYYLIKNLIALPIDQRYDINDMDKIIRKIREIIK